LDVALCAPLFFLQLKICVPWPCMWLSRTPWTGRCSPADYYGRSVIWSDFQALLP